MFLVDTIQVIVLRVEQANSRSEKACGKTVVNYNLSALCGTKYMSNITFSERNRLLCVELDFNFPNRIAQIFVPSATQFCINIFQVLQ